LKRGREPGWGVNIGEGGKVIEDTVARDAGIGHDKISTDQQKRKPKSCREVQYENPTREASRFSDVNSQLILLPPQAWHLYEKGARG
jgi:hypothetical protein